MINSSATINASSEIHYDHHLIAIYNQYIKLPPLNLSLNSEDINSWGKNNRFFIIDFARLINRLIRSKNLDEFIKVSMADFDNLGIIIKLAVDNKIVAISQKGGIKNLNFFNNYQNKDIIEKEIKFTPKNKFNQFPCDSISRCRRANLLIDRYPFVEYLRFAVIGEDDFLSPLLKNFSNFCPIILEKDSRITKKIKTLNKYAKVYNVDLTSDDSFKSANIPLVKTFITDPPYTLHGALVFICRGLSLLPCDGDVKEFYVILNPSMIGTYLNKIKDILLQSNVYLHEVVDNFSQYELPNNYKESRRVNDFLESINLPKNVVKYSSSSSLYVFRTTKPKLSKIEKFIDYKKIYQHYL